MRANRQLPVEEAQLVHRPESSWAGGLYACPVALAAFVPNVDVFADGQLLRVGKINVMNEKDAGLARNGTQLHIYRHVLDALTAHDTEQRPPGGDAATP